MTKKIEKTNFQKKKRIKWVQKALHCILAKKEYHSRLNGADFSNPLHRCSNFFLKNRDTGYGAGCDWATFF